MSALLDRLTRTPDAPVEDLLRAVPEEEGGASRAGDRIRPAPRGSVPGLFASRTRGTPGAPAIDDGRRVLTFGETFALVSRLAGLLRAHGASPERLVAVALPTGADAVIAVLAAWWAGAAFVPLDPADPPDRLRDLAGGLDVCAVVARPGTRPLGDDPTPVVEYTPSTWDPPDTECPEPFPVHGGQLAYVIHTSGSTGRPKGVMIQHDQLMDHAVNGLPPLMRGPGPRDRDQLRVALNAAAVFDVFVNQVLALALGHTLVVLGEEERLDPRRLADAVASGREVDVLDYPPALLPLLLDTGLFDSPQAPSVLLFGGESCPAEVWERLREHPRTRALNCYGPTECTIDATAAEASHTSAVTVGTPHPNTSVHVLDELMRPVPTGAVGEIFLGGPRVGRGYAGDAGLTASAFVPDPSREGGRLYRTGDRGRLRADGRLEFWGRRDRQVQIRGRRIELGEVEAALADLPDVRASVVVLRGPTGSGGPGLRAYAVPRTGADPDPVLLRTALARRLPGHMVPTELVLVDRFPLNASGKVDTERLPDPPRSAPVRGTRPRGTRMSAPSHARGARCSAGRRSTCSTTSSTWAGTPFWRCGSPPSWRRRRADRSTSTSC
ncbi:amino acid adenylation domain-containing protein [Nocardiopsis sp. ARC36]